MTLRSLGVRWIAICLAIWLGGGLANPAAAQDITQDGATTGGFLGPFIGQSFTATVTGAITHIRVSSIEDKTTTLRIYNGTGTGQTGAVGSPAASQTVQIADSTPPLFHTIVLDQPFPITAGEVYSFAFDQSGLFASPSNSDPYPGGQLFTNGTTLQPTRDLRFIVTQRAAAPIPTVSEWTLILLTIGLAIGAATYLQQRRVTT